MKRRILFLRSILFSTFYVQSMYTFHVENIYKTQNSRTVRWSGKDSTTEKILLRQNHSSIQSHWGYRICHFTGLHSLLCKKKLSTSLEYKVRVLKMSKLHFSLNKSDRAVSLRHKMLLVHVSLIDFTRGCVSFSFLLILSFK